MKLSDFDYHLPPELIATVPAEPRDHARLLVAKPASASLEHCHFFDLPAYLQAGDLLIANNSKVIPARLFAYKDSGGRVEVFLSKNLGQSWEVLIKGKIAIGSRLKFSERLSGQVLAGEGLGIWQLAFNLSASELMQELALIGQVPLPPYIVKARQQSSQTDHQDYQTVYAADDQQGSVAAPTAGLHFTDSLLHQLQAQGVDVQYLTLHVGLGTFLPIKTDDPREHQMHSEWAQVSADLLSKIIQAKREGRRIIAVGTTTARTLEYVFNQLQLSQRLNDATFVAPDFAGWVDIFIYPPYRFQVLDGLITNFHLPKSTLLMLVSALAGRDFILQAYQTAIDQGYRFYSYGDAMLII